MNNKNIKRSPNFMFVRRVLRSCDTLEQLSMAEKMIWQFTTLVSPAMMDAEDLQQIHDEKKFELETRGISDVVHSMYNQEHEDIQRFAKSMKNMPGNFRKNQDN